MRIKPLLSNPFRFPGRTLWFARARLYKDRLELVGWSWRGRYKLRIPLQHIADVEWWTGASDCNLEIRLAQGERLGLWMRGAAQWKFAILEQTATALTFVPPLPRQTPPALAA